MESNKSESKNFVYMREILLVTAVNLVEIKSIYTVQIVAAYNKIK